VKLAERISSFVAADLREPKRYCDVVKVPDELLLTTFSARLLNRLVVFVCKPGVDIADDDWEQYVMWLKDLQREALNLGILTAAGGRAPSSAQRSLLSRELRTDRIKVAVLLTDPKLVVIVKITSWFMRGAEAFKAHELEKALSYLGEPDVVRVRATIRELGGVVHKAAGVAG
jgi:hypothetical protein